MQHDWAPIAIDNLRDFYEVSRYGQVRRRVNRARFLAGSLLKPKITPGGYLIYSVCDASAKMRFIPAHRLVALTFIGPRPSANHYVAHYDGNPQNNSVGNLRWATASQNNLDKHRHGRMPTGDRHWMRKYPERLKRGGDNHAAKLCDADVIQIRAAYALGGTSQQVLADMFGVSQAVVSAIIRRKKWAHVQ